ncbi:MAG TPA: hypothetical protein VEG38_23295 [Acidimicrobiia bacterium]|nr:hypothetical protein [Acidimicrobiia bacterium]
MFRLERVKEDPHPSEDWREMRGTIVRIGATGAGAMLAVGLLAVPPAAARSDRAGKSERSSKVSAACFDASGRTQGRSHSDPDGMSNGGADKPGCTGGFDADRDGNNGCGNDSDREDDNNGRCGRQKAEQAERVKAAKAERDSRAKATEAQRDDRPKPAKADPEADRKARCERKDGATDATTSTTVPTGVSAAGQAKDCSCPKDPDAAATSVTEGGTSIETVAAATDTSVLAANATLLPAAEAPAPADTTATDAAVPAAGSPTPAGGDAATATPQTEVLGETLSRPSALARTGAGLGGLALLGGLLCGGGRLALLARKALRIG